MNGYGLVVRFVLQPDKVEEFDALVARTVERIGAAEPGTLIYITHAVDGEPRQRIFYELYRDEAAFQTHEEQPHVKEFLGAREELVESVTVDFVAPLASNGAGAGGSA